MENNSVILTEEENRLLNQTIQELHQEIPANSESLLTEQNHVRFSDATWFNYINKRNILIAGCGGIGSFFSFILSRVNPESIILYDDDNVDLTNLAGQLFSNSDIGKPKVEAMNYFIRNYSCFYSLFINNTKFTEDDCAYPITVGCFDNMEARRLLFYKWKALVIEAKEEERNQYLFIDARLAAEEFQVYCFTGNDFYNIKRYSEECLFSDSEAEETVCSYKQTSFCANMIGSIMTNLIVNYSANMVGDYRDLPYFTYYNAKLMYLKTEA